MFNSANNKPTLWKVAVAATFMAALACAPLAMAQEHEHGSDVAASKEVTGEVVDMMCYVDHNAVGEKHGFLHAAVNALHRAEQTMTLRGSCVAGANFRAHIDVVAFGFTQQCADSSQRFLQIFSDIVAQRFQRRDVNDLRFIGQISPGAFSEQRIQRREEGSQRFP